MPEFAALTLRRLLAPTAWLVLLFACNRYEWRTIRCPPNPHPQPAPLSAIGWEPVSGLSGAVHLRVVGVRTGAALGSYGVQARLLPDSAWRVLSAAGEILFDSVPPGAHQLEVRCLGFRAARAAIWLPARDSGVEALASMAENPIMLDGACGWGLTRVRKPWWKFW